MTSDSLCLNAICLEQTLLRKCPFIIKDVTTHRNYWKQYSGNLHWQRFNECASLKFISKVLFYSCIRDKKRLSYITFPIISLASQPLRGFAAIHLAIISLIFLYHALNKPAVFECPNHRPPRTISIKQTGKNTSIFLVWLNET